MISVHDKPGELGRAELGGGLPAPHAGLYEVALRGVQYPGPLLYQYS